MDLSQSLFEKPRLRKGVTFSNLEQQIIIEYREQSCSLHYDGIIPSDITSFLSAIQNDGLTIQQLNDRYQQKLGNINDVLCELDRLGLLDEGQKACSNSGCSGEDFYHVKLLPMVRRLQYELKNSPFYSKMQAGAITRNELIGFAMEYYYLIKMAPRLIAPSLSHIVNDQAYKQLIQLFVDEYDHDVMMLASLQAVGIPEEVMLKRLPLSSSFSACISLGIYARQHILSFFSAVFLFETPSEEFNKLFIACCEHLNMPQGFYLPIIKHSDINEQENHGSITKMLLSTIPIISSEEQITILINIYTLVETLHKQDKEIVSYYGAANVDLYRAWGCS